MKERIDIIRQEDNSFVIQQNDIVIGKLILDPNHRNLAKLFGITLDLLDMTKALRDYLGEGKLISEQIDLLLKDFEDGEDHQVV